jgi:transposase, IS30 family
MTYTHLSQQERYQIESSLSQNIRISVIAKVLGRSRSTLYRELVRVDCAYSARAAQAHRQQCARQSAANAQRYSTDVWHPIQAQLKQDWSPQQVSGRSHLLGQPCPSWQAIYRFVQRTWPAQSRPLRKRFKRGWRANPLAWARQATPIGKRPEHIGQRSQMGHWEADSMLGMRGVGKERVLVMVERSSRYSLLVKLDNGYAHTTARAIEEHLLNNPKVCFRSLTVDRGSEFSDLPKLLGTRLYVCDPQRPNQRGTNENTIGLIRQYIPKGVPISLFDDAQLRIIEQKLNHRPRQCLGFRTPAEVLSQSYPHCRTSI